MKKYKRRFLALFILSIALVGFPQGQEDKILIGSSLALSGHASFLGNEYIKGARAFINYINGQEGIEGKKIELIVLDDGYDPKRCAKNTLMLINENKVFALFCYIGTPTTLYVLPLISSHKIPLIGVFSGALALREPFNPYIINIRASYHREINEFITHCIEDLDKRKVAILYQYDAYGMDGLKATENALRKYNLALVAEGDYRRGTVDVERAVKTIEDSRAEAVVMVGTYSPIAKFIRLCKGNGYKPLFYSVSFVGAEALLRELGEDADGVIVSQVVPLPHEERFPAVREYKELLDEYFPKSEPTLVGFEGFINSKIFVEGIRRCGSNLTRDNFIRAIESINDLDIGIGTDINFGSTDHQGLDKVYFTILSNGRLEHLEEW